MKYIRLWASILVLLLSGLAVQAQDVKSLCDKTDAALEAGNLNDARTAIETAFKTAPKDYEVLWRLARVNVLLGDANPNKNDQEASYNKALQYAQDAVKADGKGMNGYIRRAAASGKIALFKGVTGVADLVKSARDDASYAIQLNNTTPASLATAHYILGRTHLRLTETPKIIRMPIGLGWGNIGEAVSNLKRSVELRNGFIMFHLDYARALVKEENWQEAKKQLYAIPAMKNQEVGDDARKQEAAQLVEQIKNK